MKKKLQVFKYLIGDLSSAILAWFLFFSYRKITIDEQAINFKEQILIDNNLYLGLFLIPVFWIVLYVFTGTYRKIYRKSRLKELGQTLSISLFGVILIFFFVLLDDDVKSYKSYYQSFTILFLLHFTLTFIARFTLSSITARKIHNRSIGFNTIIIGSDTNAVNTYLEIENLEIASGNKFIGFIDVKNNHGFPLSKHIPHLGSYKNIKQIISDKNVEEVIIATEPNEREFIDKIVTDLAETDVIIKIIPNIHDLLLGSVKMNAIFGAPLINISPDLMPVWQKYLKRIIDIVVSVFFIVCLSPIYLFTAIGVKLSSKGPILYSHERIGIHGKIFIMHKFRSMYIDAEKHGPALSSKNDNRITPFGKIMRKFRLDEIPQFYNVIKGDMSLVGPRPERQFFIDQIVQKAPHYRLLHKVKPGITSWGQVKYGYAENVEQMIERLKYDILYIENMSLSVDFKILIYTILIVIQGRGK